MAWLQSDLDAIKEAIASGALTVKYNDKEVTYRSQSALVQAMIMIEAEVTGKARSSRRYGVYFKI